MKQQTPTLLIVMACMVGSALFAFSLAVLAGALGQRGVSPATAAAFSGAGALIGSVVALVAAYPPRSSRAGA